MYFIGKALMNSAVPENYRFGTEMILFIILMSLLVQAHLT